MHFSALLFFSVATSAIAVSNSTQFSNSSVDGLSTSTLYSKCHTRLGSDSVALVPTSTIFTTTSATISTNITSTPSPITVYPPSLNLTSVLTTTVYAPTETTTLTVPGSTVGTVDGFTPLASSTIIPVKRSIGHPHAPPALREEVAEVPEDECEWEAPQPYNMTFNGNGTKPFSDPRIYPQEVTCFEEIEITSTVVVTVTALPLTVTAVPSTVTDYSYITTTTTPVAYVTETASVVYAGCLSNNIVSTINGNVIYGVQLSTQYTSSTFSSASASSSYSCCVTCWNHGSCVGAVWFGGSTCILTIRTTCSASTAGADLMVQSGSSTGVTASNGPCGQFGLLS